MNSNLNEAQRWLAAKVLDFVKAKLDSLGGGMELKASNTNALIAYAISPSP